MHLGEYFFLVLTTAALLPGRRKHGALGLQLKPSTRDAARRISSTTRRQSSLKSADVPGTLEYLRSNPEAGQGGFLEDDWVDCWTTLPEASLKEQYVIPADDIEGEVPAALRGGALLRCSGANFDRGGRRYEHVLDGDGMVLKLSFDEDGGASFRAAYVETEAFKRERDADSILYRNTFGTQRDGGFLANWFDMELKNVANTNVIKWGGKVLALWEAGAPYELNPDTLATIGEWDPNSSKQVKMRGVTVSEEADERMGFGSAFTAHPHLDADSDRMVSFSWAQAPQEEAMYLDFVEHDSTWTEQRRVRHRMPECNLAPHDFSLTPKHYVCFENRMSLNMPPYILGLKGPAQSLFLEPSKSTRIHVVPRDGSEAFNVEVGPFFCIHTGVAYEREDGCTVVISSGWDLAANGDLQKRPFLGAWGGRAPDFRKIPPTWLWETVVANRQLVSHRVLPNAVGHCIEHPHVDPRLEASSKAPRYVYSTLSNDVGISSPPQGYARFDLSDQTAKPQTWFPGSPSSFCEELVVVPKSQEGDDVWLLGLKSSLKADTDQRTTSLVVLDGSDLARGPVCTVPLRDSIPHGLHGCFTPKP